MPRTPLTYEQIHQIIPSPSDVQEVFRSKIQDHDDALDDLESASSTALGTAITSDVVIADIGEEVIASLSATASDLEAGATYRFHATITQTGTGFTGPKVGRVRIGPTTLTGAVVLIVTGPTPSNTMGHELTGEFTIRAGGVVKGGLTLITTNAPTSSQALTTANTFVVTGGSGTISDPTVTNLIELTWNPATNGVTDTITQASIYRVL